MNTDFGFGKPVATGFDVTIEKVTSELAKEGFGVLSEIDVSEKMKEKLGRDMPRYRILGACNPPLAWDAIHSVPDIGLLLPCNVVVAEDDEGGAVVSVIKPEAMFRLVNRDDLAPLVDEVTKKLTAALEAA